MQSSYHAEPVQDLEHLAVANIVDKYADGLVSCGERGRDLVEAHFEAGELEIMGAVEGEIERLDVVLGV